MVAPEDTPRQLPMDTPEPSDPQNDEKGDGMDFIEPTPEIAPFGLRAMTMVAKAAENGLDATQRVLLDAAQRVILHTEIDIDSLPPITIRRA